jgi:hypothetical protein
VSANAVAASPALYPNMRRRIILDELKSDF